MAVCGARRRRQGAGPADGRRAARPARAAAVRPRRRRARRRDLPRAARPGPRAYRRARALRGRYAQPGGAGRMIASVRGKVLVRRPDHVVVEAGGVGYRLAVSAETLQGRARRAGSEATLHAHLVARDDSLSLYGFATEEERDLFLQLISVSGVGPEGRDRGALRRRAARAAARDRGRGREALPGRARDRQADGGADHRRAAREGRRRARRGRARRRAPSDGRTAALAREGLRQPRLHARPRPSGCSTAPRARAPRS